MNRRGVALFMKLFVLVITVVLFAAWASLFFTSLPAHENPVIGQKQEAIFSVHAKRQSIQVYADRAIELAADRAVEDAVHDLQGSTAERLAKYTQAHFSSFMQNYPVSVPLQYDAIIHGTNLTLKTEVVLPIDYGEKISSTSARTHGIISVWPVSNEPIITSLFGNREAGSGTSKNHPGLDVRGPPGTEVFAVGDGLATSLVDSRGDPFIRLEMDNGWTCEYLHVTSWKDGAVPRSGIRVSTGELITHVADISSPHLDIRCFNHASPLKYDEARAIFGDAHVGPSGVHTSGMSLAAFNDGKVYIDPYCLFTNQFRSGPGRAELSGSLSGLPWRVGVSLDEKLEATCAAYARAGLLQEESSTVTAGDGTPPNKHFQTVLKRLEDPYIGSEGQFADSSLYEMIQEVAAEEDVPLHIVLGMIAQESGGVHSSVSETGVVGLMQVTQSTFSGLVANPRASRDDAYWNVVAGTRLIKQLLEKYATYTQRVRFMAAEYNGGAPVFAAVQLAGLDPSYEEAMDLLTSDLLTQYSPYNSWSGAQVAEKIEEIRHHGDIVAVYASMAGGSLPPEFASRSSFGSYAYEFSVSVELPIEELSFYDNLRLGLSQCRADDEGCILTMADGAALLGWPLTDCTLYEQQFAVAAQACAENIVAGCSCQLPVPVVRERVLRSVDPVSQVRILSDGVRVQYTSGGVHDAPIDWLLQGEDARLPVSFGLNVPLRPLDGDTIIWDVESKFFALWNLEFIEVPDAPTPEPRQQGSMSSGEKLFVSLGNSTMFLAQRPAVLFGPLSSVSSCNLDSWEYRYCIGDVIVTTSHRVPIARSSSIGPAR